MAKKKLIIFDMDGTLVDSSITIVNAINYVREQMGFHSYDREFILKRVNDHTINPAQVFYHSPRFEPIHERLFSEYYTNNHKTELRLYDGIYDLLTEIKAKGVKLALATNAYRTSAVESLKHLQIADMFDSIACADDVLNSKPHPDMLYKIVDELGLDIKSSLFVGDGPRDYEAAKNANMDYLMVDWGFSDNEGAITTVDELKAKILAMI
jgi:phosphoglycolate phosphatase